MSARGGQLAVIVPTTGLPLTVRRLAPRPGLPHGAAFAEGDYRPLALSPDYRALAGPEGPVARHLGRALPPHELRLSGAPDGGRSWEAPVALAHLLLARGWTLAGEPDEADLLLWATGAVDLDLRLLEADHALARKIEASRGVLRAAQHAAVAVLPPDPDRDRAASALAAMGVRAVAADGLEEALDAVLRRPDRVEAAPRRRMGGWALAGGLGGVAVVAGALTLPPPGGPSSETTDHSAEAAAADAPEADPLPGEAARAGVGPDVGPDRVDPRPAAADDGRAGLTVDPASGEAALRPRVDPAPDAPGPDRGADPPAQDGVVRAEVEPRADPGLADPPLADEDRPPADESEAAAAPDPAEPSLAIAEIHAAPGASCRAALFDPARRVARPVAWASGAPADSPVVPGLCGVALGPTAAGEVPAIPSTEPPDAFVAAPGAEGARTLFLREGVRNVVYVVPDPSGGPPARHRLVAAEPPSQP